MSDTREEPDWTEDENSFTTSTLTLKTSDRGKYILTKERNVTTCWSRRPKNDIPQAAISGEESKNSFKLNMAKMSKFKSGDENCKTTERKKIDVGEYENIAKGTHNGDLKSETDINMEEYSEFDVGNRNCETVKDLEVFAEKYIEQDGGKLTHGFNNINIHMEKFSSLSGVVFDLYKKGDGDIEIVVTEANVESLEAFEDIFKNHASTIKKMLIVGDWFKDLDELALEEHFKTFHKLVDLQIQCTELSDMPPISCLKSLRSLNISKCPSISASSVLRELSCVKRPLKIIKMAKLANCSSQFRYKQLLEVALYVKNADILDISNCDPLCPNKINDVLEKTNIQTLKVTKCKNCRDCTELKGDIGDHIKDLHRVDFV